MREAGCRRGASVRKEEMKMHKERGHKPNTKSQCTTAPFMGKRTHIDGSVRHSQRKKKERKERKERHHSGSETSGTGEGVSGERAELA